MVYAPIFPGRVPLGVRQIYMGHLLTLRSCRSSGPRRTATLLEDSVQRNCRMRPMVGFEHLLLNQSSGLVRSNHESQYH